MYDTKGDFMLPSRHSRRQTRWQALAILLFVSMVLWNHDKFPLRILPSSPRYPSAQKTCPATPPRPALVSPPTLAFNWRGIKPHHPVSSFAQLPTQKKELPKVQYDFEQDDETQLYYELMRKRRQSAVKATFARAWKSYKEKAWKQDELKPISGGSKTTFGGWGATLVDSLDTLYIMGMRQEFEEAVDAVTEIDFKPGEGETNMFEITIRYLGGLLAAYDLTDCKDERLLEKAMELGDMIYASFDTPNRMPITRWSATKASKGEEQRAAANGIIAELASFSLEFTRLSQITGDMRYYDAVTRVTSILSEQQNKTQLPGLWPIGTNLQTPDLTADRSFSLGAMADSAFEYLAKTFQLLHGATDAAVYKDMYNTAMDTILNNLLFRPMVPDNADILMPTAVRVSNDGASVSADNTAQHLACFAGGMFALGGRLFSNTTHVDIGRRLTDGCVWSYAHAPHGIMPEMFTMTSCPDLFPDTPCPFTANSETEGSPKHQHPGFESVRDSRYLLRPEAIESVFYLYRITGDPHYQDVAWDMFQAIDSQSRTKLANAAIRDVMRGTSSGNSNRRDGEASGNDQAGKEDSMESFWLGETLKYFYLIFTDARVMGLDEWVFNTEAHAFRVR